MHDGNSADSDHHDQAHAGNRAWIELVRSHAEGSHDISFGDQARDQQRHDEGAHEQNNDQVLVVCRRHFGGRGRCESQPVVLDLQSMGEVDEEPLRADGGGEGQRRAQHRAKPVEARVGPRQPIRQAGQPLRRHLAHMLPLALQRVARVQDEKRGRGLGGDLLRAAEDLEEERVGEVADHQPVGRAASCSQRLGLRVSAISQLPGRRDDTDAGNRRHARLPVERQARRGDRHIGQPGYIPDSDWPT